MIPVNGYAGQNVAVLGLGRTGQSVARALKQGGASIHVWDDSEETRERIKRQDLTLTNLNSVDWRTFEVLVLSPGVPYKFPSPHPIVKNAQECGVSIVGDMELFSQWINSIPMVERPIVIGVTGTNGKSTTTAMIAHTLEYAGMNVQMGGNIGTGVLDLCPRTKNAVFVLELSSYQLDLTQSLHCNIAILLNISADHIDRHGNFDNYVRAKGKIFSNQTKADIAIINAEDTACRLIGNIVSRSAEVIDLPSRLMSKEEWSLVGRLDQPAYEEDKPNTVTSAKHFNSQNVNATYIAGKWLGIQIETISEALENFEGLEHRKEFVTRINKVTFINDSKATNESSVRDALSSYQNIYWIAGGRAKENSFDVLAEIVKTVVKGYFIGEAKSGLEQTFRDRMPVELCASLVDAIEKAYVEAHASGKEATVILSPACASFDQFKNFEHRGQVFKQTVEKLASEKNGEMRS